MEKGKILSGSALSRHKSRAGKGAVPASAGMIVRRLQTHLHTFLGCIKCERPRLDGTSSETRRPHD